MVRPTVGSPFRSMVDVVICDLDRVRQISDSGRRSSQVLFLIHAEILRQRRSAVLLADVQIAEIIWGDRSRWPRNWKQDVESQLSSLPSQLVEAWWKPDGDCSGTCPLNGSGERHRHLLVVSADNFLGAVECYRSSEHTIDSGEREYGVRTYDFSARASQPSSEEWNDGTLTSPREVMLESRKNGRIAHLYLPLLVFGPARWSGLSKDELSAWHAVFNEITKSRRSQRIDRAMVVDGTVCPLLPLGPHVVFGGNGEKTLAGHGYRIVGAAGRGWLFKAGFTVDADPDSPANRPAVRKFLTALEHIAPKFHLTVAGEFRERWFDITMLCNLASSKSSSAWSCLRQVMLRVFADEDYLQKVDGYLQIQGEFTARTLPSDVLSARIIASGVTQREVAAELGISPSSLSDFLGGRRPWPDRIRSHLEKHFEE